jgi:IS5 family transposase
LWAVVTPLLLAGRPKPKGGRPRESLKTVHANDGYAFAVCRDACRRRTIVPRITRRGVESRERLGRHRRVVECALAWLNRSRRLTIRYERRADLHRAVLNGGSALICWRVLHRRSCLGVTLTAPRTCSRG